MTIKHTILGILATTGAAHAFTAPMPNKTQQKALAKQIRQDARHQSWWKQLPGPKRVDVTFQYYDMPKGFIGAGFPHARAIVEAGKRIFPIAINQLNPQKERDYTVTEGRKGKFTVRPDGKWQQLYTIFGNGAAPALKK